MIWFTLVIIIKSPCLPVEQRVVDKNGNKEAATRDSAALI